MGLLSGYIFGFGCGIVQTGFALIFSGCGLINIEHTLIVFVLVQTLRVLGEKEIYEIYTHALECQPLQKSPKFVLNKEDPQLYSNEDLSGFHPSREWPDIPLPALKPQERARAPVVVPEEVIRKAQSQHDVLLEWMKGVGVDLCHEMEDTQNQHILEVVVAKQKECDIFTKSATIQRLRAHIRAQHMSTTPFRCPICDKFFSDNNVLKLHEATHDPVASVAHRCETCNKGFPSVGTLNEHKKKHVKGELQCQFPGCTKKCDEEKNMKTHELYCSKNPNKPPPVQYPYCPKSYDRIISLKKHAKVHHTSRYKDLEKDMA